jgi:methionyl-tRNA synthetase
MDDARMDDFCRWCGTARKRGDRACQACGRTYGGDLKGTRSRTIGVGLVVSVTLVVGTIAVAIVLSLGV